MSYQDPNQQNQYPNSGQYGGGYNPTPGGQPQPTDPYSGQQGNYPGYGQQPQQPQQPQPNQYQQGGYGQAPYAGQQGAYQQNPYGGPNLGPTSMNMDPKLAGALSYITWIAGLVFVLAEKQNRFVRFNAIQSLMLWLTPTAIGLIASVIGNASVLIGSILGCAAGLLWIAALVGAIVAGVNAYQGKMYKLPIIGDQAEKYANQGTTI